MLPPEIKVVGIVGIPEVEAGAPLLELLADAINRNAIGVNPGDVLVVAQKIVSKSEGRQVELSQVTPGPLAARWADAHGKDPRLVELILRETRRVVRMDRGRIIVETRHGFICANAGVDVSNTPPGTAVLLPKDPDASAQRLRDGLRERLRLELAVIVSDTFGRPWREGLTNVALGAAGLEVLVNYRGRLDTFGRPLQATVVARADELAAAAALAMGKTRRIPAVLIQGVAGGGEGSGQELLRPADDDLFR